MNLPALTSLVYGALVTTGGWIGYKKAGSRSSLISGLASGILLLVSAVLSLKGVRAGAVLTMSVSALLTVFFGYRFAKGGKLMPAGLMLLCSLATLLVLWTSRR